MSNESQPAELTVAAAADILNVSVGYMNGLLDRGEVTFRQDGDSRLVDSTALMEYKRINKALRERALQELVELGEEMGLYDQPPKQ